MAPEPRGLVPRGQTHPPNQPFNLTPASSGSPSGGPGRRRLTAYR